VKKIFNKNANTKRVGDNSRNVTLNDCKWETVTFFKLFHVVYANSIITQGSLYLADNLFCFWCDC